MPTYEDVLFEPPAPVARVSLRNPANGKILADVLMLIDSGADVTLLPEKQVEQLEVDVISSEEYQLMSFDGNRSVSKAVRVDLIFLRRTFKGRFLLINQQWGILGRDILNHLSILLNGSNLTWDEYKSP